MCPAAALRSTAQQRTIKCAPGICGGSEPYTDQDHDGIDAIEFHGADCDDSDPSTFPTNPEVCDAFNHDHGGEHARSSALLALRPAFHERAAQLGPGVAAPLLRPSLLVHDRTAGRLTDAARTLESGSSGLSFRVVSSA